MSIGAPTIGTSVSGSAGGTSVTMDITYATVGEWAFVAILVADSQASAPTAPSGWTVTGQGQEGATGSASSCLTIYQRLKQAGDTTTLFTWPTTRKFEAITWSWPGLDPVTPIEGTIYLAHSAASTSYATSTVTPTAGDRWIAMVAGARGTAANQTWTPDGAMTERIDANHGGTTPFTGMELADTNGSVTQAGHTYTAVDSQSDPNGGTIAFALIPAQIPYSPRQASPARDYGIGAWVQRDRRDASAQLSPALPSPLDSAWQAGAGYWHAYGDTATRDRRAYAAQRTYSSPPGLLDTAELENELLGSADTGKRYAVAASHSPRWWMPRQPRRDATSPGLLDSAELENELLGGADTAKRYGTSATHVARVWMPVQPKRDGTTPGLLDSAELENELLGGSDTAKRYAVPASHGPRAWWPQQPKRDATTPGLLDSAELEGPLLAGDTRRHYAAAAYTDRREVPQQRAYVSDPLLLLTALLENELLGGSETAKRYLAVATNGLRWWMPQQPKRDGTAPGLLDAAELEGALLAGDVRRHYGMAAYVDRREVPAQRTYISDPSFYPTIAATDPLTLAWGDGGTYWTLYNGPALQVDRRLVPQQRRYISDPGLLSAAELENELLGGAETAKRYGVPGSHAARISWPQQPKRDGTTPGLLDFAELEGPLLAGDGRRHYATAGYWDRRLAPQQRTYMSDPSLLITALLENELLGSGATFARYSLAASHVPRTWLRHQPKRDATSPGLLDVAELEGPLLAGDIRRQYASAAYMDRRIVPQQRVYQSDPLLLASALLENELLGGADAGRRYGMPSAFYERRETVPQRVYLGPPVMALLENELLGAADDFARRYRQPFTDRRQTIAYLPRRSDLRPLVIDVDPVLLAAGVGGDMWRRVNIAAYVDRRAVRQLVALAARFGTVAGTLSSSLSGPGFASKSTGSALSSSSSGANVDAASREASLTSHTDTGRVVSGP